MFQRVTSQITAVKKDMVILEKSEFSALLAENEVGAFLISLFSFFFTCVIKGFKLVDLSAEAQNPDSEAQGSAGRTCLFWNLVQRLCFEFVVYYS